MYIEGLDVLDNMILNVIKENARMSYSEIGEKVGVSRVSVKKRMEAMEEKGIIQGYKTIINTNKIPDGISFIVDVEAFPEEFQNVLETLSEDTLLQQIYTTTGDCRIHAVGTAPNASTLESRVNYLFRNTKGIKKLGWHMLLSTIKDVDGGVDYERSKGNDGRNSEENE